MKKRSPSPVAPSSASHPEADMNFALNANQQAIVENIEQLRAIADSSRCIVGACATSCSP